MDKSKIYLNLSKCTEEEIKETYKKIKDSDQNIHTQTERDLINGIVTHCYWFLFFDGNAWNQNETPLSGRTELTYPEFIKLFEGGETSAENSEVERIRRSAIENLVLMEIDKKMEHLKEIEVARIEGVLTGLKICKEMWAQGTISHENIQEEIYHYQEEWDYLNSNK